ncbi:hypothetical protein CC80DRAFT_316043 [Byssothecium circinans]|uniref:Uncharacterized protein n=1 Tax=Byssothecium circinans TaxID=147558 RepID=A0A6A5T9I0_9PLEO|nr:hypothetical protein CC80DRAFT_316043 [Byssothecium circinans]
MANQSPNIDLFKIPYLPAPPAYKSNLHKRADMMNLFLGVISSMVFMMVVSAVLRTVAAMRKGQGWKMDDGEGSFSILNKCGYYAYVECSMRSLLNHNSNNYKVLLAVFAPRIRKHTLDTSVGVLTSAWTHKVSTPLSPRASMIRFPSKAANITSTPPLIVVPRNKIILSALLLAPLSILAGKLTFLTFGHRLFRHPPKARCKIYLTSILLLPVFVACVAFPVLAFPLEEKL